MKRTISLTIMMLVLATIGVPAQKTPQEKRILYQKSEFRHTAREKRQTFIEDKNRFRQSLADKYEMRRTDADNAGNLKSAEALPLEKLDSIVDYYWNPQGMNWFLGFRNWYEYDSLGRNTKDTWLGAESPVSFPDYGGMYEMIWDDQDRLVEDFDSEWLNGQGFVNDEWGQYSYDANGNHHTEYKRRWNAMSQTWYPDYTDTIIYDGMDKMLELKGYRYDTMGMAWIQEIWSTWEYDSAGILVYRYDNFWNPDSMDWQSGYRMEYFFDQNGRDTARISYTWSAGYWNESTREVWKYNASGALTFEAYYYWDGESDWLGNWKAEYTLDGNNRVEEEISYYWGFFIDEWYIDEKYTYSRDGSGNLLEEAVFRYDTAGMFYWADWKDIYEWDLTVNWSDLALPYELIEDTKDDPEFSFANKPLKFTELIYDTLSDTWDTAGVELLYFSSFGSTAQPVLCEADFTFRAGNDPQEITYLDGSSGNITSWYWTFGDGTSSTLKNPVHVYNLPGTYRVSLSTTGLTDECTNTVVKQIKVGNTLCNAEFSMLVDTLGMNITLTNLSQGTGLRYSWSFGDGEISKEMSPTHTYKYAGSYNVSLTIQNTLGTCMDRYSMSTRVGTGVCRAGFDVFVDSANHSAKFIARNENPANIYRWEFGDGSVSKTRSVEKTFTHPGYYSARLTVSNNTQNCVNSQKMTVLVGRPSPGGKAGFIYVAGDGNKVKFNDRSLGEGLSHLWDFNDGNTSTDQNPENTYAVPGYYNVCLTVFTADGQRNTHCERIFAGTETSDQCLAQFEYKLSENQMGIVCLDRSLGNPDKWLWTYSDGWTTNKQNPSWTAKQPGYELIQQTIMNSANGCRDDAFGLVNMGAEAKLKAAIGYIVDTSSKKADTYPVDFVGTSVGDAGKLKWDFGDGTVDTTSINPTHVYVQPGIYTVCLTITNTTTGAEDKSCETITVGNVSSGLIQNVSDDGLRSYPNPFSQNTRIEIMLARDSEIDLAVYDLMGRVVKTVTREFLAAGNHSFDFSGTGLESGNYYLVLKTRNGIRRTILSVVR